MHMPTYCIMPTCCCFCLVKLLLLCHGQAKVNFLRERSPQTGKHDPTFLFFSLGYQTACCFKLNTAKLQVGVSRRQTSSRENQFAIRHGLYKASSSNPVHL